jgi:hypothetical protein
MMRMFVWGVVAMAATPPAVDALLAQYAASGASAPDAARGRTLWMATFPSPDGGPARSCGTCHGPTLSSPGSHATTGEPIEPMTAPGRLGDAAKVEKWFGRNCRWTLGRDCTAAEKADVLLFLSKGGV